MQRTFTNRFTLQVAPATQPSKHTMPLTTQQPPGTKPGSVPDGQGGIALPQVFRLKRTDPKWGEHFDDDNACLDLIEDADEVNGKQQMTYSFYLNVNNLALQTELKASRKNSAVLMKQFEIGAVLVGLGLIHEQQTKKQSPSGNGEDKDAEASLQERVRLFSRAVAPVLLPMIHELGELGEDDLDESDLVGQVEKHDVAEADAAL